MSYAEKSRARDFDQHASKIRLGLEKLKNSDAKRAIWELFQNAVDISKDCHIRIEKTDDGFKFKHDGEPFMDDSLASLIKQVTNKEHGTQEDSVGQYGTGFITTHIYGKRIKINGYAEAEGGFIQLTNFLIDRTEDETTSLSKKIDIQDKLAAKLIDETNDVITKLPNPCWTSFEYIADTSQNNNNVKAAIDYLRNVLPVVFVFNDKLSIVEVIYDEIELLFKKETAEKFDDYWIVNVFENDEEKSFICLFSDDEKKAVRVVLPYDRSFEPRADFENYPKLFLFYPLIGSERNGINCIIHANTFSPQEERDSLYLEFDNNDIKPKVEASRAALEIAFSIVVDFVEKHPEVIPNTLPLCKIFFEQPQEDSEKNDFWEEKKSDFVDKLLSIALIETKIGRKSFFESCFFDEQLLQDETSIGSIYSIATQFYKNLPIKQNIVEWSKLVASWNKGITLLTVENVLKEIEKANNISDIIDKKLYLNFLTYVCKSPYVNLFDEVAVLPNIYGAFKLFPNLKDTEEIDNVLIKISEQLFPEEPESFVDKQYKIEKSFTSYTREDFKRNINEKAQEITDKINEDEEVPFTEIEALIDFISINTTTEINRALTEHLSMFFNYETKETSIENSVKDFDYRSSLKTLFRYFIADISKREDSWLKENIAILVRAIEIVYQNDDFKRTVLNELKVYPNQNYKLCSRIELKLDKAIPKELKDVYFEVIGEDFRDQLALSEVARFLSDIEGVGPEKLGNDLEKHFHENELKYTPITDHREKDKILRILQHITAANSKWGNWFPVLYSQRLEVLVGKIIEPKVQQSMFSILTKSDERISLLGILAELPNLDEIVKQGKDALNKSNQARSSFRNKYLLGKRIEDIIRQRISSQIDIRVERPPDPGPVNINGLETIEEQDGQDIIIKLKDHPVYYIEVKSRWNVDTPFRISRNQTIRASDNADKYALVSIDMTRSGSENPKEVELIGQIIDVIQVNVDIGDELDASLVTSYKVSKEREENCFYIDGDFRTYVPFAYIDSGMSLIKFEDFLIQKIQDAYAKSN